MSRESGKRMNREALVDAMGDKQERPADGEAAVKRHFNIPKRGE